MFSKLIVPDLKVAEKPSFFNSTDFPKSLEDIQTILDIALTIIICLGSSNLLPAGVMGGLVLSLSFLKAAIAIVQIKKEKRKPEDISSIVLSVFLAFGLAANGVLSVLLITGQISGNTFSMYALGIDLTTISARFISRRTCGPTSKRYSFCQKKTKVLVLPKKS